MQEKRASREDGSTLSGPKIDRRTTLQLLASSGLAGALAGCLGDDSEDDPSTASEDGSEDNKAGGEIEISLQKDEFTHMHPYLVDHSQARAVVNNVRNALLRINQDGEIVGDIATDWDYDETTIEFDIRDDVVFHNGEDLTADDIVYSIETLQELPESPVVAQAEGIENVTAPDETTVVIELEQPDAAILAFLTREGGVSSTINRTALEEMGEDEYDRFPVSTGPFEITDREPGVSMTLEKHDEYFGTDDEGNQLPYLDRITVNLIPEPSTAWSALQSGEVQYVESLPPELAAEAEQASGITTEEIHGGRWFSLYMLCNDPADVPAEIPGGEGEYDDIWEGEDVPTFDKRVRQAIAMAIDRDELVQRAYHGWAEPAHSLWNPDIPWLHEENPEPGQYYDSDEAERLLDEAGYTDDPRFSVRIVGLPEREREMTILEQQLGDVGIEVEPVMLDPAAYWPRIYNFEDQIACYRGTRDFDPYFGSYRQLHSPTMDDGVAKGIWNRGLFVNEEFDEYLEESRRTVDQEERAEILGSAMEIFHEETPMAMTVFPSNPRAMASELQGVGTQLGLSNFHHAHMS